MNAAPDASLVTSTLGGDEDAFAVLVERHRTRIRAVAHSLLGDWTEAEDVAQEALFVAHATLERLRDPERFGAWLAAIATNLARMRLRSRRAGWTSLDELAGGVLAPSTEAAEESDLVREALDMLSGLQREAVLLHYVEGLSTAEIAGLRGEDSIAELCRREGIAQSMYYGWSKEFLEAGKRRLAGDTARAATGDQVKDLRREAAALKEVVAEQALELRLLKKSMIADGGDPQ